MATPDPRHKYVRFYLATLGDLDGVIQSLAAAHAATRDTLRPYESVVREVPGAPTAAPAAMLSTTALWRPRDASSLTGLTDIYEVFGRFTFQGEDDANIAAVGALVKSLRAEIDRQRAALKDLERVPALATTHAATLEEKELTSTRAQQAELLKQFEPAATQLKEICNRLYSAIRAEKKPDLGRIEQADAHYQDYVLRVKSLYAKALPFLREQLAEVSRVAGCEVPPSWPDSLPFAASLPADLITPPPAETPALTQLRQASDHWTAQESALQRAQDELGVQLRRVEGEIASYNQREAEAAKELNTARLIVRWATKHDELDAAQGHVHAITAEGQSRTQGLTQIAAEIQRTIQALTSMQQDASEWAQGIAAKESVLAKHKENEPAIFGKDEWRRKTEEIEAEIAEMRGELTRRQQSMQAGNGELLRFQAREKSEQANLATLTRQHEEARARVTAVQTEISRVEQELGASRPAKRMTTPQAEETLLAIHNARTEAKARIDRLAQEARRIREDGDRATVQLKQLTVERDKQKGALTQAEKQSTTAYEEALRQLTSRRQQGFESHIAQVLSGLEDSLAQVERIFIDPARKALLVRAGVMSGSPEQLRTQATAFAQAVEEARRRAEETFAAQQAALDRIEQEFVQKAPEACRAAWAA